MTPTELRDAIIAFGKSAGPKAHITAILSTYSGEAPLRLVMYPRGIASDESLNISVVNWTDAVPALTAAWDERRATYDRDATRRMALAIIRITADTGGCSDAALRADGFDDAEIARLGGDAVGTADAVASNGPFSIVAVAQSNAMAAE